MRNNTTKVHILDSRRQKAACGQTTKKLIIWTHISRKDFIGREMLPSVTCRNCAKLAGWI